MCQRIIICLRLPKRSVCSLDNSAEFLPPGKLPGHILDHLIRTYIAPDPSVLIGPGVGRDAAAIQIGDRVIVVKTDPITFATSDAGRYLINVNANDIACMGATPRWILVTALLPENATSPAMVEEIFISLATASRELGISLVGGHTEITLGLGRPILVGQMIGDAQPADLLDLRTAQPGDAVLLCSEIAIEGTAILAREAADSLAHVDPAIMTRAANLLTSPGISVLPAANLLRDIGIPVRGLHDPTEGGIMTAISELTAASGLGAEIDMDAILVLPETAAICDALGLDPMGLIASGSLLAVIPDDHIDQAVDAFKRKGIPAAKIGRMLERGSESVAHSAGTRGPIPSFAVDELARFFAGTWNLGTASHHADLQSNGGR
jgi:hydrogenase expression/formation protein HypE